MKNFIIILLVCIATHLTGQDLGKIEKDLLKHLKQINYWTQNWQLDDKVNSSDSVVKENILFREKLMDYTSRYPSTLSYDFNELKKEGLVITTSADKKFRIYSWDTQTGGTMHFFDNVYQYRTDKVYSLSLNNKKEEGDPGEWYSDIFTLNTGSAPVYLAYYHAIYSTKDSYQGIKLFGIHNNQLNDTLHLIKTRTGLRNKLGFAFDFFSVLNREERPVRLIEYDEREKIIKIPVVLESGEVTDRSILYQFTGKYFEKKKQ